MALADMQNNLYHMHGCQYTFCGLSIQLKIFIFTYSYCYYVRKTVQSIISFIFSNHSYITQLLCSAVAIKGEKIRGHIVIWGEGMGLELNIRCLLILFHISQMTKGTRQKKKDNSQDWI